MDCGRKFEPHQMDFDHRDPSTKLFKLTAARAALRSTEKLRAEADKCDVVCANCHRLRTVAMSDAWSSKQPAGTSPRLMYRKRAWQAQAKLLLLLRSVPCTDCTETYPPYCMDFDHRDPSQKRHSVMAMVSRTGTAAILTEVAKCDVVCANCHRMRTYRRRHAAERE